ncbi:hypothetical protein V1477_006076, partial [Vespula maculifrons]
MLSKVESFKITGSFSITTSTTSSSSSNSSDSSSSGLLEIACHFIGSRSSHRFSRATDVRIERSERRSASGHDHVESDHRNSEPPRELQLGIRTRANGGYDPPTAGKLAAPCGPQARAQRGPGPPLLPGKVRSHGSD